MSNRCNFPFWFMLDYQQADLEERIRKKEVLEDKVLEKKEAARQRILKYQAYIRRLRKTLELSHSHLIAKTYEEITEQNKEIEK